MHDSRSPEPGRDAPAGVPFVRRVMTVVLISTVAALSFTLILLGIEVLLAAFGGLLLAVLLRAATDSVRRFTGLADGWALTVVVALIIVLLGAGSWLLLPQISDQVDKLGERLPEITTQVEDYLQQHQWGRWVLDQVRDGAEGEGAAERIQPFFAGLSNWSSYFLVALFVGLFGAANPELYKQGIVHLFPLSQRERMRELIDEITHTLRWWLIGQAIAMVLIGVSTTIVLLVFGVPLAILMGIVVGLLGFVPYLGPLVGAIPIAIIAAAEGASTLLYVMLVYVAVQMLEGYVATPLIQHRTVYLPPAFTIIIQILMGAVIGAMGVVLATPLAAVMLVLTRFYRRDFLGDTAVEAS